MGQVATDPFDELRGRTDHRRSPFGSTHGCGAQMHHPVN
jgi:hypothetical protein